VSIRTTRSVVSSSPSSLATPSTTFGCCRPTPQRKRGTHTHTLETGHRPEVARVLLLLVS
jgi:hypothetical protein